MKIGKIFKLHARGGGCTVVAEVGSREQKREVMVRERELKRGIYIDDDLTKMKRERQNHLRDKAKEEREKGNDVKIGYEKIFVKDSWYRWNEKEKNPSRNFRPGLIGT